MGQHQVYQLMYKAKKEEKNGIKIKNRRLLDEIKAKKIPNLIKCIPLHT